MTTRYEKDTTMVTREIAGEMILVPIRQNVGDLQCIYTLNEVGARIWKLLDEKGTLADIVSTLVTEYEVEREQAEADMTGFLAEMESIGAMVPAQVQGSV
ncbi:MAG: PqqD family protein [Chloroflexi bacterium]|nr:PqqD family protein [Chloroflexota bacterium]